MSVTEFSKFFLANLTLLIAILVARAFADFFSMRPLVLLALLRGTSATCAAGQNAAGTNPGGTNNVE